MRRNPPLLMLVIMGATLLVPIAIRGQDARPQNGSEPVQFSPPPVPQDAEPRPADLRRQADEMRDLASFLRNMGKQEVADQLLENAEQLLHQAEQLERDHAATQPSAETALPNEHPRLLCGDDEQTPDKELARIGWGICEESRNPSFEGSGLLGFEALDKSALSEEGGQLPGLGEIPPPGVLPSPVWFTSPGHAAPAAPPAADVCAENRPAGPCVTVPMDPVLELPDVCVPKARRSPDLPGVAVPLSPPVPSLPSIGMAPSGPLPDLPGVAVPPSPPAAGDFPPMPCPMFSRAEPAAGPDRLLRAALHLRQAAAELQSAGLSEDADTLRGKAERLERRARPCESVESLRREVAGLKQQVIDLTRSLEAMRGEMQMLMGRLERTHRVQ